MREKKGIVTSTKMEKTAVVTVATRIKHSKYNKIYTRTKKYHVDNPDNSLVDGQTVLIEETRPMSKLKNWKIKEILIK